MKHPDLNTEELGLLGLVVLFDTSVMVLLSAATHLAVKAPWPQILFLDVFRRPELGLLAVLLTPQPLFSPLTVLLLATLIPLFLHVFFLQMLWGKIAAWNLRSRLLYMIIALVPIFGPIASQTLLQSLQELE